MDEKEFDYLNVIPLVDVMLVLLTIVLTTSTFIATGGIKVELPKTQESEEIQDLHPRTVVINKEGRIWLDAEEMSLDQLTAILEGFDRETPILVRADRELVLQGFVDVFAAIRQCGFTRLSLQTEQSP
ncbi:ExbD/TolR family protein [Desulfobulbus elongatus]|uniref:ExbD/TolR family protein n=1 Tax=Desulfobulbus elongatus TaxID=53332 RepID=UPI000480706B|nr:biopolymer transporter ExbD [Desulfobulbus elongatus]